MPQYPVILSDLCAAKDPASAHFATCDAPMKAPKQTLIAASILNLVILSAAKDLASKQSATRERRPP